MFRIRLFFLLSVFSLVNCYPQENNISLDLNSIASYISPDHVPFWLRSNQFGNVPIDKASLGIFGGLHKEYTKPKTRLFDWGVALEGRANIGYKSNFTLIEGSAKVRLSIFELKAGRSKEIMGLCDSSLSSGAFAISGNSLGIPKIQIAIPEFYSIPILGGLFAFKGNFAHGWIGKVPMNFYGNLIQLETYFHQKSFYGRFGKPEWRLKLFGGFNHQVFWGKEYGDFFNYSPLKTYLYVLTANNRIGNSLGSIDVALEYKFKNVRLLIYRQNLYDAGALYYLANIRDGLNGLSVVNKQNSFKRIRWEKILVEVFYTKSQGGELGSVPRPSIAEDYYNNWQYIQGWSYNGIGLGNPFINSREYTRVGLASDPNNYFINNRIVAFHLGFEGSVQAWDFILKTSYSFNYGTYNTSDIWNTGYGLFGEKKQFSAYLDMGRELKSGVRVGVTGAFDVGELYYDSVGLLFRVGKTF